MAIGPSHHRRHGEAGGRRKSMMFFFSHLINFTLKQFPAVSYLNAAGTTIELKDTTWSAEGTVRKFARQGIGAVSCNK